MPLCCHAVGPISMRAMLVAVFFVPVYAWFYLTTAPIFASPDERTVAVFAQTWAETGSFKFEGVRDEHFVPRSVTTVGTAYVPSGFLGLFLIVGFVWRYLGGVGAMLLVPALAAFAPLALFVVWKRLFSARVAWFATIALWVFPAWAYYAGRGFLPNVAFVACIALAFGALSLAESSHGLKRWQSMSLFGLGGLSLGVACMIRPVELLWLLPVCVVLAWLRRHLWRELTVAVICAGIPLAILAYWQAQTYGAWYAVGYMPPALIGTGLVANQVSLWTQFMSAWFPFGLHPLQATLRFVEYLVFVYWWALPWAMIGLVVLIKSARNNRAYKMYAGLFTSISAYLILYYGSWPISDHPDASWMSIGVAYNRYWLPIFVLAMPLLVLGVDAVVARWRWPALRTIIWSLLLFCSVGQSFAFGPDSFWALRAHSVEYSGVAQWVMEQTSADTILITNREEKYLWPQRTVWFQPDQNYDFVDTLRQQENLNQFAWLTNLPVSHVQDLNQRLFLPAGIDIQSISQHQSYQLYVFKPSARD